MSGAADEPGAEPGRASPEDDIGQDRVAARAADPARSHAQLEAPVLTLRLPLEQLTRYAGLTALATAVLVLAGILSTVAYLSAWRVPAELVRMDPLTAALRSETVLVQILLLVVIVLGLQGAMRYRLRDPRRGRLVVAATAVLIALVAVWSLAAGFVGWFVGILGAVLVFGASCRRYIGERAVLTLIAVIAVATAIQTGRELGHAMRDHPKFHTELTLTTRAPLAGLEGTQVDQGWTYARLYLVMRDAEALFVSRPGSRQVWLVPAGNVLSVLLPEPADAAPR